MGTVEIFEHTADVGFRIRGHDLDDLFRTAAEALFDYIVTNRDEVVETERESLSMSADSPLDLLVAWLNELIFRCETRHRLYATFAVHLSQDGRALQAEIAGERIDHDRHILDHEVKAVTQHGLEMKREGQEWVAEMILDI